MTADTSPRTTRTVRHRRVHLALHELRAGVDGRVPLLLLHGLGEASPDRAPAWTSAWPGGVHALDFTGHGCSEIPAGGGYTAENLLGDADAALAALGPAAVVGRGLGAYVALLLAGARAADVAGTVLADGPGMAGAGPRPATAPPPPIEAEPATTTPDPVALVELAADVRPPDYAASFARMAMQHSALETPIVVTARVRVPWIEAVLAEPGVRRLEDLAAAVEAVAAGGGLRP